MRYWLGSSKLILYMVKLRFREEERLEFVLSSTVSITPPDKVSHLGQIHVSWSCFICLKLARISTLLFTKPKIYK